MHANPSIFLLTKVSTVPILTVNMNADRTRLGDLFQRNRLQQKAVAAALGVSRMTVWQWVHGRTRPTSDNLLALASYLQRFEPGIEPKDLVGKAA